MAPKTPLWEDRDVRFDITQNQMKMRPGESVVDRLDAVEDTKGNSGDRGKLIVTTLRVIWHSATMTRVSLSVGYNCVINMTTKTVNSKLRGLTEALYILTRANNTRFEFIFTNLIPNTARLFTSVIGVYKAYSSSRLYRELKLRGAVVNNKELRLLPQEQISSKVNGVWNLSSDQGNLGTFIISNVRLVWFANMNELFNISLPFIQMASVKVRESKFGMALVVESTEASGGYVLGFRIDPTEKLHAVHKELLALYNVYSNAPVFGVEFSTDSMAPHLRVGEGAAMENDLEEEGDVQEGGEDWDVVASYLADGREAPAGPVYSEELGLAVERLKESYTLAKLWEVIPS